MALILIGVILNAVEVSGQAAQQETTIYDPNPAHPWNRLYESLFVRTDSDGKKYGFDELDNLFWYDTKQLLVEPSHHQAIIALNEFLNQHEERLIRDPIRRALLQRDLWEMFDWSASLPYWKFPLQRKELQSRLASAIHRLALSTNEIASLPDNYAVAETNHWVDLPQGLFQTNSDWVTINVGYGRSSARLHTQGFPFGGRPCFW